VASDAGTLRRCHGRWPPLLLLLLLLLLCIASLVIKINYY